jgi:membrane associated rhomboid family serine protease
MSSGADLFVVCKQCGSEVSPYITECPYCGHRLRRRAPKLPSAQALGGSSRASKRRWGRFRSGLAPAPRRSRSRGEDRWVTSRPYATAALVLVSCGVWVAWHGGFVGLDKLAIAGPLKGDWWKLFTSQFAYASGLYEFVALVATAIFGWLLERRHGGLVVIVLFLVGAVGGAYVATLASTNPVVAGANGGALALLCAWAVPDLLARGGRRDYNGDLLGTGVIALVLLVMPIARPEANPIAGGVGVLTGYLGGLGLARRQGH